MSTYGIVLGTKNLDLNFLHELQYLWLGLTSPRRRKRGGNLSTGVDLRWHKLARDKSIQALWWLAALSTYWLATGIQENDLLLYLSELFIQDVMIGAVLSARDVERLRAFAFGALDRCTV